MGYIYKITNDVNYKIYIGKTEYLKPEKRWRKHLRDYKKKRNEKHPLYYAMNKYGENHFHFEVIEKTDTPEKTCEREQYWIYKLRTYVGFDDCNGYNATLGGDGKPYLNLDEDEVIKYHIEEAYYIVGYTAKHFKVDSVTIKTILTKHNVTWLSSLGANCMMNYIDYGGVVQIDLKSKVILNLFESICEANRFMGKKKYDNTLYDVCNGKKSTHQAYGYLWFYGKDYFQNVDIVNNLNLNENKPSNKHGYNFNLIYEDLLITKSILKTMRNLNINLNSCSYIHRQLKKIRI